MGACFIINNAFLVANCQHLPDNYVRKDGFCVTYELSALSCYRQTHKICLSTGKWPVSHNIKAHIDNMKLDCIHKCAVNAQFNN